MKKLTLLLAAVLCLCSGKANAQDGKGSINFVPYAGVNYSDFSGDIEHYFWNDEITGKCNFMVGARFDFQITNKSTILVDVNYRRLGTNAKDVNFDFLEYRLYPESDTQAEIVGLFKKLTVDCISFGPQYKQNIGKGLSVRAGVECSIVLSARYYERVKASVGLRKGLDNPDFDPSYFDPSYYGYNYYYNIYNYPEQYTLHRDDFDWYSKEEDEYSSITDAVSDNLKIAIPLGVSYDFKNFSINATYHLPITNCFGSHSNEYHLRNQAFDLTLGYRLPLRKR